MTPAAYEFGEVVRIHLPPGCLSFVNIYEGSAPFGDTDRRRFGFAVDLDVLPAQLTTGVKVSELGDVKRVMITAGVMRPEVHVAGLASSDEEFQWLRDRQEEMALRNVKQDGLFNRFPLVVDVARYEYNKPGPEWQRRHEPLELKGVGIGLRKLTIVAKE